MTSRYRHRHRDDVDLSALSPYEAEIVRVFAAALEQAHAEHVERMRRTLSVLELLRDGAAEINADMRAGQWPELPEGWLEYRQEPPGRP
jgi:hypothetical protein